MQFTKKLVLIILLFVGIATILYLSKKQYETKRVDSLNKSIESVQKSTNNKDVINNELQIQEKEQLKIVTQKALQHDKEFINAWKANYERRLEEIKIMPQRTEKPIEHYPLKVTNINLSNIPPIPGNDYENASELVIIDYRESLIKPDINADTNYLGVTVREWLFKETEDAYPVKMIEKVDTYADGTEEIKDIQEFVADSLVARVGVEHSLIDFEKIVNEHGLIINEVLLTTDKGDSYIVLRTENATLDSYHEGRDFLMNTGYCKIVEENFVSHFNKVPNDPFYVDFKNGSATVAGQNKDLSPLKMPKAWDVSTGSNGTIVAVVDTGILGIHEALKDNMWHNPDVSDTDGYNWGIWSYNGSRVLKGAGLFDFVGHGTHCAGIIGAKGNDSIGTVGINWNVKLMGCRINNGTSLSVSATDALYCWNWAVEKGAKVLNNSWGGKRAPSDVEKSAALSLKNKGIIVACAAGNNGVNIDSTMYTPACLCLDYDNFISVAATNRDVAFGSSLANSNYGPNTVTIAAPGESVLSPVSKYSDDYSTVYLATYAWYSGTSMATPHVTGAAALLISKYPTESYLKIIKRLTEKATKLSFLSGKVKESRFLNVGDAISEDGVEIPKNLTASQGKYEDKIIVNWDASNGATHYRLSYSTTVSGTKKALGNWQTNLSYTHDKDLKQDQNYYYWVQAANSSSGANATDYSSMATGWLKPVNVKYIDQWEPADNEMAGATNLTVSTTKTTTPRHGIVYDSQESGYELDQCDFYKFNVTSANCGKLFHFRSTIEGGSVFGDKDLRAWIFDKNGNQVGFNDDIDPIYESPYNGTYDFHVTFIPQYEGYYYLMVAGWNEINYLYYTVSYWIGDETPVCDKMELPVKSSASTITLTLNSKEETQWTFYPRNRPSWITKINFIDSTNKTTIISGSSIVWVKFVGEATLTIDLSANSTGNSRTWNEFLIIPDKVYRLYISQEANSLPSPENITASRGTYSDRILISWNKVEGAKYYRAFRADTEDGTPIAFENSYWQSGTSIYDTSIKPGQKYYYFVQASANANGASPSEYSSPAMGYAGDLADKLYKLTVINGTGTKECQKGAIVQIRANTAPLGQRFAKWTGDVSPLKDVTQATTQVVMPASNVTVTATYVPDTDTPESPFTGPVKEYSINPNMKVYVKVTIDGHYPTNSDWIAAYCGNEKRGEAQLVAADKGEPVLLKINWASTNDLIKFKVYDSANQKILNAENVSIYASKNSPYSKTNPLDVAVGYAKSPYGEPVSYPQHSELKAYVTGTILGDNLSVGDYVAVFCGSELRAVSRVAADTDYTLLKISRAKATGEIYIFKIFDIDAVKGNQTGIEYDALISIYSGNTYNTPVKSYISDGNNIGTIQKPVKLIVTDEKQLQLQLNKDWTAFSLNIIPSDKSLSGIWGSSLNNVLAIQNTNTKDGYDVRPGWEENTLSTIDEATQYWVLMNKATNISINGTICDESDYTFTLKGNKSISKLPYIPQQTSVPSSTFAQILENTKFKLLRIESSSGGVYYPPAQSGNTTLTVLKPGDVYWVYSAENSEDMVFSYSPVTSQSLNLSRSILAENEKLPDSWNEGNPWTDNQGTEQVSYKVHLTYFGENIATGDEQLYVAAFVIDKDGNKQRISNANHSEMQFGEDAYIPLTFYSSLSDNHTVFFEVFDKGMEESDKNPRIAEERYLISQLRQNIIHEISVNGENENDIPMYTIKFELTSKTNSIQSAMVSELLPNQDKDILIQKLPRGSNYKSIKIPRITTNYPGQACWFEVETDDVTTSKTYNATFSSLLFDLDQDEDGKVRTADFSALRGMLYKYYGVQIINGKREYLISTNNDAVLNQNSRPHSIDMDQNWRIDLSEYMTARGFLMKSYEKEEIRIKESQEKYGYGTGFMVK